MDSNRIKNVALGARETLIKEVDAALERVLAPDSHERVANSQAVGIIERTVRDRGRESVVEQVAYTWFNRLCALRYMDVRGYTPVGLVSPRSGETLPAVLADARRGIYAAGLDISQRDKTAISSVLNGDTSARDPLGRAYVMLLVAACKTYERSMDYLFGAGRDLGPAIELLAPTDLLSSGSLLQRICTGLDDATCNEGVEVMGWLYQFYVSERKDAFFASGDKASAADIPPATQLFTPNYIVRYLVENSLGRLWMLNFPDSELIHHMKYFVKSEDLETEYLTIYSPEDITFLDPACGSGHILVYAFDLLYLMYEEEGYRPSDIPELILKNNLTGIEIDDRAAEIASFCLEMKALEKDPAFLSKDVDANVVVAHAFHPNDDERRLIQNILGQSDLMDALAHFDEIGSLYVPHSGNQNLIECDLQLLANDGSLAAANLRAKLADVLNVIRALSNRYSITCANPPYMGNGSMNAWFSDWVKRRYANEKSDLCTCFIKRCLTLTLAAGYASLVTMQNWMFLGSFEKMRKELLATKTIVSMAHLGPHGFDAIGGEVVTTTATTFLNKRIPIEGIYIRLVDGANEAEKKSLLTSNASQLAASARYVGSVEGFSKIPGTPIVYWASDDVLRLFQDLPKLAALAEPRVGMATANNDRFMRLWFEVSRSNTSLHSVSRDDALASGKKWFPFAKGGTQRKWFGNNEYVVNWQNDGQEIRSFKDEKTGRIRSHNYNLDYIFSEAITWTVIGSDYTTFRYSPVGFLYSNSGYGMFFDNSDNLLPCLAFLNSTTAIRLLNMLSPGVGFESGYLRKLPFDKPNTDVNSMVERAIELTRSDWNAFETSWDFTIHPLGYGSSVEGAFRSWAEACKSRFDELRAIEEGLNETFADLYCIRSETDTSVPADKVSIRLADLGRDIRSLVSYGVGCMFGRYSLDEPGLILTDEGSTLDDYHTKVPNPTFEPDRTGIIPITDADTEWFEDDIVAQFRRWLAAAYGQDTLDENVAFIEHALGKNLRTYFVRDFYDDHLKTYQKRPIYWLFQSPKKGLSALVYLHRYSPNTVTTLLTEYIRPLREQMEAQARLLEVTGNARDASTATKYRATIDELDKWEHDVIFPLSQKHVALDLDDGVKANYGKPEFKGALRKVKGLN